MKIDLKNKWAPLIIAVTIALIVLLYYVLSGRSSYDLSVRELGQNSAIVKVDASDSKKIVVKCKTGESYQINFESGQGSYDGLIFNSCGETGGEIVEK